MGKKYTLIVTEKAPVKDPKDARYGILTYFTNNPWEGKLKDIVYGDDAEELTADLEGEDLFYQLYNNTSGKRIGYGSVDETIELNIKRDQMSKRDALKKYMGDKYTVKDKFMTYMRSNKTLSLADDRFSFQYDEKSGDVKIITDKVDATFGCTEDLQGIINEYDLPLRICDVCGMPMVAGFTDEEGSFWICSYPEFVDNMDQIYGAALWREAAPEKEYCYEYYDKKKKRWLPEYSFYTELE